MRRLRRALVVGADVTRAVGPRAAARIVQQDIRRRRQGEGPRDSVYDQLWRQAAGEVGARVVDRGNAVLEISRGGRRTWVRHQETDLDGPMTARVARDKALALTLLTAAGIAVPEHVQIRAGDTAAARRALREWQAVAVKPSGAGGGFGVTANLRSQSDLDQALRRVGRGDGTVVLERQVPGTVHRVLLLDGRALDVLRREPPHVTGDGTHTIHELIAAENERRLAAFGAAGIDLLRVDLDCVTALAAAGIGLDHVPADGRRTHVKTVTNQNCASDNRSLGPEIGEAVLDQCVRAAAVLGIRLAGVDVVTADPMRPLAETGGAILEVNAHPGLHHHQHVSPRCEATHVTAPVVEALLSQPSARV